MGLAPKGLAAAESLEAQVGGLGWRRLARTNLVDKFLDKVKNPRRDTLMIALGAGHMEDMEDIEDMEAIKHQR